MITVWRSGLCRLMMTPARTYSYSPARICSSFPMDQAGLDWEEVTQRSLLDERRGLVITQVAVLEELIDQLILYVVDSADLELTSVAWTAKLGGRA
jgi:hypothetical protein